MTNWNQYTVEEITKGADQQSGTRLLVLFSNDYSRQFGEPPCTGCPGGLARAREKLINGNKKMSDWKVIEKYNGTPFEFGSNKFMSDQAIAAKGEKADEFVAEFVDLKNKVRQDLHEDETPIETVKVFFSKYPAEEELELLFEAKPEPLVVALADGKELKFTEVTSEEQVTEGVKAKIGRANANGELELADGRIWKFEKGAFVAEVSKD